ncbi:MAG: intracellular septation protein [Methylobacteriaceae bacterium]|nr:intracellular septation protein [Methylobacteriaceae bacterium]
MTAETSRESAGTYARAQKRVPKPAIKLALEFGPLAMFFVTNYKFGIFPATGVLMVSVLIALAISYYLTRRLPIMPVVTAIAVTIFGALTFLLHDEIFIKLKPTIVNSLFGATLLGALAFGKPLLPIVLDSVMHLSEEGWRKLTLRWGLFFFVLAAVNEIVWRTQTTDFWAGFKAFGIMPLTIIFALTQVPLIMRYEVKPSEEKTEAHF